MRILNYLKLLSCSIRPDLKCSLIFFYVEFHTSYEGQNGDCTIGCLDGLDLDLDLGCRGNNIYDVPMFLKSKPGENPGRSEMSGGYITSLTSMSGSMSAPPPTHPIVFPHILYVKNRLRPPKSRRRGPQGRACLQIFLGVAL